MLNLRYLSRIAARNAPDRTGSIQSDSDVACVIPAAQTPATGRKIGTLLRIGRPITIFPGRLISRNPLGYERNTSGAGVLAATLSSLTIGQPSGQLDSVARLSLDFLTAQTTRTRSRDDPRSSSNDLQQDANPSTAERPLSILPEIDLHAASEFELSLGEYGLSPLGVSEQLARRPLSLQSLAHTIRDDSSLPGSTRSENDSNSRSTYNEIRSGASDVQPAVIISKDFALQPIPIEQTSRRSEDVRRRSTGSSPPALVRNLPEHPNFTRPLSFRLSTLARCESPSSISSSFRHRRPPSTYSIRPSTLIATDTPCKIIDGTCIRDHDCLSQPDPAVKVPQIRPDSTSELKYAPSRRILIIGSNYTRATRRTATIFSVITLEGTMGDKESLKREFMDRGYSVESMVDDTFTRQTVLAQVAQFFAGARSGDVRAVVFTGHAWRQGDGPVMLIPPHSPTTDDAIPESDWQDNIQKHAKPGVIVFSILAHCFSGDFMRQKFDLQNAHTIPSTTSDADPGPIFITFSSASGTHRAYESSIERVSPYRVADHFLHALVSTMRSPGVQDWNQFFQTFEQNFEQVREIAAEIAESDGNSIRAMLRSILSSALRFSINLAYNWPEPTSGVSEAGGWHVNHQQTPVFTVSGPVPCSTVF